MYGYLKAVFKYGVAPLVSIGSMSYCVTEFVVDIVFTTGVSMEPMIQEGDVFLLDRTCIRKQLLNVGDVVVARSPERPQDHICKRVKGLAGDTVSDHRSDSCLYQYIPRGHVWLEGDNKEFSKDSRDYGPVPCGLILGRLFFRIYPLKHCGWFPSQN